MPDETPTAVSLPMLRGEHVWLRASTRADFVEDVDAVSDADTGHFLGLKGPIGPEGSEHFAQQVLSQQGQSAWSFTICLLEDNRRIGNVTLRNLDRENGSVEVAIVITEKASQGRGLGTDALNCVVDFGFGELRLERIYLHVFDYNGRAQRSYEKAGFETDAILRRSRFHRGEHHDVLLMSILRGAWLAMDRRRAWDPPSDS
ncbi:MAG TPA: GNAT family protein [Candidatus Limnocylindria bacterium]|jgi:RimJ/RimL family protein N-acetyltransferase